MEEVWFWKAPIVDCVSYFTNKQTMTQCSNPIHTVAIYSKGFPIQQVGVICDNFLLYGS